MNKQHYITLYKRNAQGCGRIERKPELEPRRNFCKFQLFGLKFTCNLQKFRLFSLYEINCK